VPISGSPRCASCRKPIDASNFLVSEAQLLAPPGQFVAAPGQLLLGL
jgi:hypothetical protein